MNYCNVFVCLVVYFLTLGSHEVYAHKKHIIVPIPAGHHHHHPKKNPVYNINLFETKAKKKHEKSKKQHVIYNNYYKYPKYEYPKYVYNKYINEKPAYPRIYGHRKVNGHGSDPKTNDRTHQDIYTYPNIHKSDDYRPPKQNGYEAKGYQDIHTYPNIHKSDGYSPPKKDEKHSYPKMDEGSYYGPAKKGDYEGKGHQSEKDNYNKPVIEKHEYPKKVEVKAKEHQSYAQGHKNAYQPKIDVYRPPIYERKGYYSDKQGQKEIKIQPKIEEEGYLPPKKTNYGDKGYQRKEQGEKEFKPYAKNDESHAPTKKTNYEDKGYTHEPKGYKEEFKPYAKNDESHAPPKKTDYEDKGYEFKPYAKNDENYLPPKKVDYEDKGYKHEPKGYKGIHTKIDLSNLPPKTSDQGPICPKCHGHGKIYESGIQPQPAHSPYGYGPNIMTVYPKCHENDKVNNPVNFKLNDHGSAPVYFYPAYGHESGYIQPNVLPSGYAGQPYGLGLSRNIKNEPRNSDFDITPYFDV